MLISKKWLKAQLIQRTTLSAMFLEGTSFFYDIMQKGHISTKQESVSVTSWIRYHPFYFLTWGTWYTGTPGGHV